MCKWGTNAEVYCPLGFNGQNPHRKNIPVDACIANLVQALNAGNRYTISSCCGHGKGDGLIELSDGTDLIIRRRDRLILRLCHCGRSVPENTWCPCVPQEEIDGFHLAIAAKRVPGEEHVCIPLQEGRTSVTPETR